MKRKAKITLILSSITLALAITAQYYTNHKINRSLQSFPYHLKDQLTLHVTEKNANFFQRELVFSLEDDKQRKTDIISTKLTALPFTIIAESHVPEPLISELNKKLNITIDKNSINSKFSVVGDYLQSNIVTQFRDLANKPQDLQIHINYAAKTKSMEIQSQLSGFNYDAKTKFDGLSGQYVLIPTGDHQYDLAELELKVKSADIYLLNGENTNIKLEQLNYSLSKSLNEQHYDLSTEFNSKKINISNKNKSSEQDQTDIDEFVFSSKHTQIPNSLSFYREFSNIIEENKTLPEAINLLIDTLFNNDTVEAKVTMKALSLPDNPHQNKFLKLKDLALSFEANNKDRQNINAELALNAKQIILDGDGKEALTIKGLSATHKLDQINLTDRLSLLPFYTDLFKNTSTMKTFPEKDNPVFIEKLKQSLDNFNEKREFTLNIDALSYANTESEKKLAFDKLNMTYFEDQQQAKYGYTSTFSIEKFVDNALGLQVNDLSNRVPFRLSPRTTPSPLDLCYDNSYRMLCVFYLSEKTYQKWQKSFIKETAPTIHNAELKAALDTLPNSQAYPISANFTIGFMPSENEMMSFNIIDMLPNLMNANVDIKLTLAKGLIKDAQTLLQIDSKERRVWDMLHVFVKPNDQLAPYFIEQNDSYVMHYVQQDDVKTVNDQPFDDIMNKLNSSPEPKTNDESSSSFEQSSSELPSTVEQENQSVVP
ncbi:MAG: hypothetical protein Q4D86_00720 [Pasteurella oralis]|uniref:hypothetical protein n=1 Tax=Pasteurella oralis TaxID=1071947 RepID=UPI0026F7F8BC|nr:hypothetical protein [Pasteurella oralis]